MSLSIIRQECAELHPLIAVPKWLGDLQDWTVPLGRNATLEPLPNLFMYVGSMLQMFWMWIACLTCLYDVIYTHVLWIVSWFSDFFVPTLAWFCVYLCFVNCCLKLQVFLSSYLSWCVQLVLFLFLFLYYPDVPHQFCLFPLLR